MMAIAIGGASAPIVQRPPIHRGELGRERARVVLTALSLTAGGRKTDIKHQPVELDNDRPQTTSQA